MIDRVRYIEGERVKDIERERIEREKEIVCIFMHVWLLRL